SAGLRGTRPMTQPAKGQEPSMEEILASIRRVIADEEPAKDTTERRHESLPPGREGVAAPPQTTPRPMTPPPRIAPAAAAAPAPPKTDEEIDAMLAHLRGPSRQPGAATRESGPPEATTAPEPAPALETRRPAIDERGLLSAATTAAVNAAFDTLARAAQARGGRTLA